MCLSFLIPLTLPFNALGLFAARFCVLVVSGFRIGSGCGLGLMILCCCSELGFKVSRFSSLVRSEIALGFFPHWTGLVVWVDHSVWV